MVTDALDEEGRPVELMTKSKLSAEELRTLKLQRQKRHSASQLAALQLLKEYAPDEDSDRRVQAIEWAVESEVFENKSKKSIMKKLQEIDHPDKKKKKTSAKKKNATASTSSSSSSSSKDKKEKQKKAKNTS